MKGKNVLLKISRFLYKNQKKSSIQVEREQT